MVWCKWLAALVIAAVLLVGPATATAAPGLFVSSSTSHGNDWYAAQDTVTCKAEHEDVVVPDLSSVFGMYVWTASQNTNIYGLEVNISAPGQGGFKTLTIGTGTPYHFPGQIDSVKVTGVGLADSCNAWYDIIFYGLD